MLCGFSAMAVDAKKVETKRKKENSQPCKRSRKRRRHSGTEKDKESHHTYSRIDPHCQSTWRDELGEIE